MIEALTSLGDSAFCKFKLLRIMIQLVQLSEEKFDIVSLFSGARRMSEFKIAR